MLRYSQILQPAGIAVYEYLFNLNSLYDPDRTGAGHQPLGFDQLTPLYGRYRVFKVRYDISWIPGSNTGILIAAPTNRTGGIGSTETALETYSAKHSAIANNYSGPARVRGVIDLATLNGKTLAQYTDDDTTGAIVTTSPSELLILHTVFGDLAGSAATGFAVVNLEFDCEFSDPVQLSTS